MVCLVYFEESPVYFVHKHCKTSHYKEIDNVSQMNLFIKAYINIFWRSLGWSGGAKVLGKLPVPGRPTYLDYGRARAYCACNRCGWGLFGHFFSHLSLLLSFSLSLGDGPI